MTPMLTKVLLALVPAGILFLGSVIMFAREKRRWSVLQLLGTAGMLMVLIAHVCEALRLFPWMGWGQEHSIGHYLDLTSAIAAITLFPLGHLLHALTMRRAHP